MKVEIQSDSSTANSLTDRLGAGQRTKHIDTRYIWIEEPVQYGDLSIKKVLSAKNFADVGTKPVSASVLQQHCQFAGLVFGSHTPHQDEGTADPKRTQSPRETRAQKQTVANVDREHRDGCAS